MKTSVQLGKGVEQLFGKFDENLRLLERGFQVEVHLGDGALEIEGSDANVQRAGTRRNPATARSNARQSPSLKLPTPRNNKPRVIRK